MDEIKQVSTRIPLDLYIKVKIKAAQTGKTMTEIIKESLEKWVSDDPPKESGDVSEIGHGLG